MKSAEEWLKQNDSFALSSRLICADIRAIQADALRHAAEMCFEKMKWHSNPDFIEIYQAAGEMLKAEAARSEETR